MHPGTRGSLPFVFIGGLRRSGTTMMSEALTQIPYAFIFREPGLARGTFNLKAEDARRFLEHGIDLEEFRANEIRTLGHRVRRRLGWYQGQPVRSFRQTVLPRLLEIVQQVGVKEIYHAGWRHYVKCFPNLRMVHLGRDPRDIFLSLHSRVQQGRSGWQGPFTPERVAEHLNQEFSHLQAMERAVDSTRVRYEDVCQDQEVLQSVLSFVQSPIPGVGAVGGFLSENAKRKNEYDVHGESITTRSIARWKQLDDDALVDAAHVCMAKMEEYCEVWGYV